MMTQSAANYNQENAERYPASYETYLHEASETYVTEWVDGEVIKYMPPLLKHQEISWFLFSLLSLFVSTFKLGKIGEAPFEVKLWADGPSREPDIFFVSDHKLEQLTNRRFEGAPDLIIEIISPSSVREDKVRKFDEYEQAGVSEYWIIDPRTRQKTAEFFQRDESGIYQAVEVDESGIYNSTILPHFWLNVDWLWEDPMPNHQLCLAEVIKDNEAIPAELRQLYQGLFDYFSKK